MAGLLLRELKLRGLIERVLVVCPANLTFQWQRELNEKFDEKFLVFKGGDLRDQFGVNQWLEQKQVITSLDLAKRTEILPGLAQVHWDLVIVDEAHRMAARAVLPAPHQGGDGLLPGAPGERSLGRAAGVHQTHPAHRRLRPRRCGDGSVPADHAVREAAECARRGAGRRAAGAGGRVPDGAVSEAAGVEHPCDAAVARNPLEEGLKRAHDLLRSAPPDIPDHEDLDELEDAERERLERLLEAVTLAGNERQVREEIAELRELAAAASAVEGGEAKLGHLRKLMQDEGFFDRPEQRLLIFTEFKDTLDYLMQRLQAWGFNVGCIHGGMKPGSRDEPGTRLAVEQQFRDGLIQVLVATEAAGEGINLQCCHVLFNYDIPWNPNRLEQRMGRIHRYGQRHDCLIFNFVATNTIEGRVLQRLLLKLQEIRDALDDDAVFNVVGEVLPPAHVERVLRAYYAGKLGDADLEDRLMKDVDEGHFRSICQTALEGLAAGS